MFGIPHVLRVLTRARSAASLGLVALVATPLIGMSHSVAVAVDGDVESVRTYAATVGELLDDLDVGVGPVDRVVPSRASGLEDGLRVRIVRAKTVSLVVDDGPTRTVTAPVDTVSGVLEAVGLGSAVAEGAEVAPSPRADVEDGAEVIVRFPKPFTIHVDGETIEGETFPTTVGKLLAAHDVELGERDTVDPAPRMAVDGPVEVTVARVSVERVVEEVAIPHGEERRESGDLYEGTTRVVDEGRDGLERIVYRVRTVDGDPGEREQVDRQTVREPQPRVIAVGTKAKPRPEPAPAAPSGSVWDRLARCESGGNWAADFGNGFYGGLQFSLDTWRNVGGSGYPHEASRSEQIKRGKILQSRSGWGAWPDCSRELGLR